MIGLVAFLRAQGLERADRYSSIIAAFLAVATLIVGALGWLRRRQRPAHAHHSPWGTEEAEIVNKVSAPSESPAWPEHFDGYRLLREESGSVRVFGGQGLATVMGFPATMNGCAHQRFFIRWRTLGGQSVAASLVSVPDLITVEPAAYGSSGWMSSDGCGQPAWELIHDDNSLVDVQLAWQVWIPTA
ncbi:hypothetical protein [Micromonospora sp. U21]|uniref:hypothetical protein n=1 Tax=Micromonospora sp. U21 TaxID=2824899 RepID=UPI001B385F50|nr:hypothetical protein [Micromonospora sp. U21]MBQ0905783.1 hypothetical protein [Micromonospora sp. U21]